MPAKATLSRKTHIVQQLNPDGSCQRFVILQEEPLRKVLATGYCTMLYSTMSRWSSGDLSVVQKWFLDFIGVPQIDGTRIYCCMSCPFPISRFVKSIRGTSYTTGTRVT